MIQIISVTLSANLGPRCNVVKPMGGGIENGNIGPTIFEKKIFVAFKMQIATLFLVCHLTPKLHQMFKLILCLYFYSSIGLYFCSVRNDHVNCSQITQLFLRGKVDEKNSQSQGMWIRGR